MGEDLHSLTLIYTIAAFPFPNLINSLNIYWQPVNDLALDYSRRTFFWHQGTGIKLASSNSENALSSSVWEPQSDPSTDDTRFNKVFSDGISHFIRRINKYEARVNYLTFSRKVRVAHPSAGSDRLWQTLAITVITRDVWDHVPVLASGLRIHRRSLSSLRHFQGYYFLLCVFIVTCHIYIYFLPLFLGLLSIPKVWLEMTGLSLIVLFACASWRYKFDLFFTILSTYVQPESYGRAGTRCCGT